MAEARNVGWAHRCWSHMFHWTRESNTGFTWDYQREGDQASPREHHSRLVCADIHHIRNACMQFTHLQWRFNLSWIVLKMQVGRAKPHKFIWKLVQLFQNFSSETEIKDGLICLNRTGPNNWKKIAKKITIVIHQYYWAHTLNRQISASALIVTHKWVLCGILSCARMKRKTKFLNEAWRKKT